MLEHDETLTCLKCGYALQGLRARKCEDCGHVYLRCPECGASQAANEEQNRMLLRMRARARRLPGMVQVAQIILMVIVGTLLIGIGFLAGAAKSQGSQAEVLALVLLGGAAASLLRLFVLRLRNSTASALGSVGFVMASFIVGMVAATAIVPAGAAFTRVILVPMLIGAILGAVSAPVVGWLVLWMLARDDDRAMLRDGYNGALRATLRAEARVPAARHLLYCHHCAAELPAMVPQTCDACGLLRVVCPACGRFCSVPGSQIALARFGETMRGVRAAVVVCVRLVVLLVVWLALVLMFQEVRPSYDRMLTQTFGRVMFTDDLEFLALSMLMIAVLRWFVVVGRLRIAVPAIAAMVFVAGLLAVRTYHSDHPLYLSYYRMDEVWGVLLVSGLAAAVVLVAAFLAALVKAALPRRRVAMLEEAVPELTRQQAQG